MRTYKVLPNGQLRIRQGKIVATYAVAYCPTSDGLVVELRKVETNEDKRPDRPGIDCYHVQVNHGRAVCDCMGHLRHGVCKHAAVVLQLTGEKEPLEEEREEDTVGPGLEWFAEAVGSGTFPGDTCPF